MVVVWNKLLKASNTEPLEVNLMRETTWTSQEILRKKETAKWVILRTDEGFKLCERLCTVRRRILSFWGREDNYVPSAASGGYSKVILPALVISCWKGYFSRWNRRHRNGLWWTDRVKDTIEKREKKLG